MLKSLKTKLFAIMLAMLSIPMASCAQSRILSSLPSGESIEKVYIGSALIKLGSSIAVTSNPEVRKYSDLLKEVKAIEVYDCENKGKIKAVQSQFDALLKTLKCEELMYSEEDNEYTAIYMFTKPGDSQPSGLIIYNAEPSEISIVVIHGTVDISKISSAISK